MDADTNISATSKVLGTVELVENILLHVQPDYNPALKCISKSWQETISSSSKIRQMIRCLAPQTLFESFNSIPMPIYSHGSMIAIHPALRPHTISYDDDLIDRAVMIRFEVRDLAEPGLRNLRAEFVTRPFCRELQVYHKAATGIGEPWALNLLHVLHVEGGIRIGHLLKQCRDLAYEQRMLDVTYDKRDEFVIQLREKMSEEDMIEFKRVNELPPKSGHGGWFKLQNQWPVIEGVRKIESR